MLGGFHWWDLIPVLFIVLLAVGLVILVRVFGRSIGEGYAREQRRQEQHPEQP
ncbi:MAG TPA: hypothetical protein VJO13_20845 [Ktedonobacterales bacterium]|nr:hypothetical protein [Ktedonobacterales bacterium]